jgi:hypothetical protein
MKMSELQSCLCWVVLLIAVLDADGSETAEDAATVRRFEVM